MKNDVYQVVTDCIIGLLESGTVPWHRPWKGGSQAPQNFISRKAYRGINFFLLSTAGFTSPFWLTFKQAQSVDARVKKGEKSFPVVFWKIFEEEESGELKKIPFLRYHSVFNVAQCEGITVPASPEITEDFHPIEKCEQVVTQMPRCPAIEHGGGSACYSPLRDAITMPEAKLFESSEAYYGTLFHELTHATGHGSRLNRKEITDPIQFGSNPYSREELVAEMGAAFLCGHCGIENTTLDQSASYIQSWLERLREDRKLVVLAAAQAQKACDFILDIKTEEEIPRVPQLMEPTTPSLHEPTTPYQIQLCEHSRTRTQNTATARTLKIEEHGDAWKGKLIPKIRLKGLWLERLGFKPGHRVRVQRLAHGVLELRSFGSTILETPATPPVAVKEQTVADSSK